MDEIKVLNMVVTMLSEIPIQGKYAETYGKCLNTLVALQKELINKNNNNNNDITANIESGD